ncbi:potassium/proton antiporter [Prosthecobacter sp. SYSU 5D2]|uniref:potassium/proton antiporter n=1 Tax=Prosthecobacter sp. SYSU 5D2 TaxID=3134134 RepID=UPI0031FECB0D
MDIAYILIPSLLILVVLASVWLDRFSVPVILVALGAGILFGSDVLNLWHFEDVALTNQVANVALVFILFQGGFATKHSDLKAVALTAGGLATWGVFLTAVASFFCLWGVLGWSYEKALLLSVIISSTDAAAIFSILRRQSLPPRLSGTLEIESAANDPMAILMTMAAIESLTSGESQGLATIGMFIWKFTAGPALGWVLAHVALSIFNRLNPQDRGYYYVLLLGVVLLTYGVTEMCHASGMLGVFTTGFVMGNSHFIYKQGVRNFSAALATIANIGVFVLMGLLVFPSRWATLWVEGIILFAVLTFVARPVAVWLGTLGMGLDAKSKLFTSWAGLRGAVPIVLATYPLAAGMEVGEDVFNLVFFAVILSISIQGSTLTSVARWLKLSTPSRPMRRYGLELVTMAKSELDLVVVDLPDPKGKLGPRIRDLKLPPGAIITLITRDNEVLIPKGNFRLQGWDQVTVLARIVEEDQVREALLKPFEQEDTNGPTSLSSPEAATPPIL